MTSTRKALIAVVIILLIPTGWYALVIFSGAGMINWFPCVTQYRAEPIEGQVVDTQTKEPVEGVIVVAHWQLVSSTFGGNYNEAQAQVLEAVTDKAGRYRFPGWGPKPKPSGQSLRNHDPELLYYKPGYKHRRLANDYPSNNRCSEVRYSRWNGKTIEMDKFTGTLEEYYKTDLGFLGTSVGIILRTERCGWKQIPHMVIAMHRQKQLLQKKQVITSLFSIDQLSGDGCGSRKEFFREYLQ